MEVDTNHNKPVDEERGNLLEEVKEDVSMKEVDGEIDNIPRPPVFPITSKGKSLVTDNLIALVGCYYII